MVGDISNLSSWAVDSVIGPSPFPSPIYTDTTTWSTYFSIEMIANQINPERLGEDEMLEDLKDLDNKQKQTLYKFAKIIYETMEKHPEILI